MSSEKTYFFGQREEILFYRISTILSLLILMIVLVAYFKRPIKVLYQPYAKGPQTLTLDQVREEDVFKQVDILHKILLQLNPRRTDSTLKELESLVVGDSAADITRSIKERIEGLSSSNLREDFKVLKSDFKQTSKEAIAYTFSSVVEISKILLDSGEEVAKTQYMVQYDLLFLRKRNEGWHFGIKGYRRIPMRKWLEIKDQI